MTPILSYCTTCCGRLHHLKDTLPPNLAALAPEAEIVVLDYGSQDGLWDWMHEEMLAPIKEGKLAYCYAEHPGPFQMSHAKNLAHAQARGVYVCNLDADHYARPELTRFLLETLAKDPQVILRTEVGGGLIALSKANFVRFGGYDEDMIYGWGHDDNDLWDRAGRGLRQVRIPKELEAQRDHPEAERNLHSRLEDSWESFRLHGLITRASLARGKLVANAGRAWGTWPKVVRNFED